MRKRIPKQRSIGHTGNPKSPHRIQHSPLITTKWLCLQTQCHRQARQFEKMRVERLLGKKGGCLFGGGRQKVEYSELIHDYPIEGLMDAYYPWETTKQIFTNLITANAIKHSIVLVDFKKDHYRMTTRYQRQVMALRGINPKKMESTMSVVSLKEERHAMDFEGIESENQAKVYELLVGSIAPMVHKTAGTRKGRPARNTYHSPPNTPVCHPTHQSSNPYQLQPHKHLNLTSRPHFPHLSPPSRHQTEYDSTCIPKPSSKPSMTSRSKMKSLRGHH